VELAEKSYTPYFFLAHRALMNDDAGAASQLIKQALDRSPGQTVKGQLLGWLATCNVRLGSTVGEIELLFEESLLLVPSPSEIRDEVSDAYYRFVELVKETYPSSKSKQFKPTGIISRPILFPHSYEPNRNSYTSRDDVVRKLLPAA